LIIGSKGSLCRVADLLPFIRNIHNKGHMIAEIQPGSGLSMPNRLRLAKLSAQKA